MTGKSSIINQQERQKALEAQLSPEQADVRIKLPVGSAVITQFPQETPCFPVHQISLSGSDPLTRWLRLQPVADQARGQCLGGQGINLLMSAIQNRLIDRGYITTRVLAPPQDLTSGKLELQILEGSVSRILLSPDSDSYIQSFTTLPVSEGDLLNLRDTGMRPI